MLEKCVLTILELDWNQRLGHKKTKLKTCHYMAAHFVHTTTKHHFTSKKEWERLQNVKKWKMHVQSVQNYCTVFRCQICKFVGFLLPSSSWLLKLLICAAVTFAIIPLSSHSNGLQRSTKKLDRGARRWIKWRELKIYSCSSCHQNRKWGISRCCFAEDGTELFQSASCTCSTLIFRHPTNETHNLKRWHCRYRCLY